MGFKTEHRHRGMKFGIAPYSPDDWGRQLAAGGTDGSRTRVQRSIHTTFSVDSHSIEIPLWKRRETGFSSGSPFVHDRYKGEISVHVHY